MADLHQHDHDHADEVLGSAIGFRLIQHGGELYLAEAEIAPYVDDPDELGATLVFHPMKDVDPTDESEGEWPSYAIDIDDELTRDPKGSIPEQFAAILRQLYDMSEQELIDYLKIAMEDEE